MKLKQLRLTENGQNEIVTRSLDEKPAVFKGYAAVFNVRADLGWFYESLHPDAFNEALFRKDDVRSLFNHDPSNLLGRTTSGTLKLVVDEKGLDTETDIPDTSLGRDLTVLVDRGDISQMSFGFYIEKDHQIGTIDGLPWFEIQQVRLLDIALVTYPAYESTSVEVKRSIELRAEQIKTINSLTKNRYLQRSRKINIMNI